MMSRVAVLSTPPALPHLTRILSDIDQSEVSQIDTDTSSMTQRLCYPYGSGIREDLFLGFYKNYLESKIKLLLKFLDLVINFSTRHWTRLGLNESAIKTLMNISV